MFSTNFLTFIFFDKLHEWRFLINKKNIIIIIIKVNFATSKADQKKEWRKSNKKIVSPTCYDCGVSLLTPLFQRGLFFCCCCFMFVKSWSVRQNCRNDSIHIEMHCILNLLMAPSHDVCLFWCSINYTNNCNYDSLMLLLMRRTQNKNKLHKIQMF